MVRGGLPFRRGKDRNKAYKNKPIIVNIKALNLFKAGETVDLKSLISHHIVDGEEAKTYGVKILGDGELKHALTVKLPISKRAEKKLIKAGGKVEVA
jgi:large subunit ribosomal protein L15